MITPAFGLTATERVLPRLALDFTTATLDPRVTFTRTGNTATVINSSGVIVGVNADIPRFDFDPVTLVCRGLLIEESRTNVLLNSLIDGTSLATQAVVVTAAARTLSFYGTGQIVLSGAASATVTGTGAYPTRTTFTFTPSAGVLTLTVTGTVQFAQLEAGAFATSYIPTTASQVTRTADVATMTGANFSDWYNASEGTFAATGQSIGGTPYPAYINDGTANNRIGVILRLNGVSGRSADMFTGGSSQLGSLATVTFSTKNTSVLSCKTNSGIATINALAPSSDTTVTLPTVDRMNIGATATATSNLWLENIMAWDIAVTEAEVQAFSKG